MANKMEVIMPEIIIYNTLNSIFQIVKDDFAENSLEDTILYTFFGQDSNQKEVAWETFNYFDQAQELFINRGVEITLGYNMETASMGCIHILLPQETGRPFSLGADENYQQNYVENVRPGQANYFPTYSMTYDSNYNLMITSDNTMEVLLIYNFIKASFIALNAHIELSGLRLPKFGGQDVNLQSDLVPPHIFHRSFNLSFFYEVIVPDLFSRRIIKKFKIAGINTANTTDNEN